MQKIQDFRLLSSIEGLCLLSLMSGEKMCGYEITRYIRETLGEIVAHPLIYRKLSLLTQHGYTQIVSYAGNKYRPKVNYQITQKGLDWLVEKRRPIIAAYELVKDIEAA